jgi:uncharacterized protein YndB with AHSA1/START domain
MATPQSQPENTLELRRTFAVPRERVFRAWTDAREFALWFHPTADYTTVISELNLKVGGTYKLEMHHKDGNVHKLSGTYREIKPPEKLVFTWRWSAETAGPESLVALEFHDLGNATEICVTHGQLPSVESRDKHNQGWTGCLEQLAGYLKQS